MTVQLYGFPISTCTLRVATVLKELNIPFEFHSVDIFKGEQKLPAYTAKAPFGSVPYIVCPSVTSQIRIPQAHFAAGGH